MRVTVNFFTWQWFYNCSSEVFTLEEGARVRDLRSLVARSLASRSLISSKYTSPSDAKHILISLNGDFAGDDDTLRDGDIVAFFPPVSGG